jgi:hypothetical protein
MNNNFNNEKCTKENFRITDVYDPTKVFREIALYFLFLIIKICLFGFIIYSIYKQTGLMDEKSIKNYMIFLIVGMVVLYLVTFLYFIYRCYNNDVSFSDMDYKGYALSSLLAPSFIVSYTIFIILCENIIKKAPGIGKVIYAFIYLTILVIPSTGIIYNLTFEFAYALTKCSNK